MTLSQMHERLRVELLRRIQRGTLSISLLSRQTKLGNSHLSNFLRCRRRLSIEAIDRILTAQHMAADELLPENARRSRFRFVPVVSHMAALFEPHMRASSIEMMLNVPPKALDSLKARPVESRRSWERFVAIRISARGEKDMEPVLLPDALAVIDRHYNSLIRHDENRPNLYAVRNGAHLSLRYVDFAASRLVLRPLSIASPVELIEMEPEVSPGEYLAGRVVLTINEV
jgi:hypothetical protein